MNVYHKSAVPKTPIKVVYRTLVDWCLSVCTGSAVFAACGLLDGKTATSNKKAFDWVCTCGPAVKWEKEPRFCKDGKFYTSAGVSAAAVTAASAGASACASSPSAGASACASSAGASVAAGV